MSSIAMAMRRKRALSRQQRDDASDCSPSKASPRANDLENELGTSFPSPPAKKSLHRRPFVLKGNCINRGRIFLRGVLSGDLRKTIPMLLLMLSITSLVLWRMIFDVVRYSLMPKPKILYGTPNDWEEVAGCLSRTYRREVNDYFDRDSKIGKYHDYAQLPLNPDVEWNWSRFSSSRSSSNMPSEDASDGTNDAKHSKSPLPRRRLLIAQYSGKGSYERLLEETGQINRAYAKKFGHDYVTLVGTALKFPGFVYDPSESESSRTEGGHLREDQRRCRFFNKDENANGTNSSSRQHYNYESQSAFNKIPLLFKAMEDSPSNYDQVLILDSDAMIVDFDYDITSLLVSPGLADPDHNEERGGHFSETFESEQTGSSLKHNHNTANDLSYFLVAYRVYKYDWPSTWDINNGITLWNLRHPSTRIVAEDWLKLALSDPKRVLLKSGDQYFLQRALQRHTSFLPAIFEGYRESTSRDMGSGFGDRKATGKRIRAIRDEFEYYDASVIKHFKRDAASWSRTGLDQRLLRIRDVKDEMCRLWREVCPP